MCESLSPNIFDDADLDIDVMEAYGAMPSRSWQHYHRLQELSPRTATSAD
jgi:hypothetical protein